MNITPSNDMNLMSDMAQVALIAIYPNQTPQIIRQTIGELRQTLFSVTNEQAEEVARTIESKMGCNMPGLASL